MKTFQERREQLLRKHPAIKPLVAFANANGFKVRFRDRTYGDWAYGYFDPDSKDIVIYTRWPGGQIRGLGDIAFVLAHEVRHIQHFIEDKYHSYYHDRPGDWPKPFLPGICAERDCDAFARSHLGKHNMNGRLMGRVYPPWRLDSRCLAGKTLAHRQYIEITSMFRRLSIARRAASRIRRLKK